MSILSHGETKRDVVSAKVAAPKPTVQITVGCNSAGVILTQAYLIVDHILVSLHFIMWYGLMSTPAQHCLVLPYGASAVGTR